MTSGLSVLAESWMRRVAPVGWCDLKESLSLFPELRNAIAPPTFSIKVNDGVVSVDHRSAHLEAAIDAQLIAPVLEPPAEGDEDGRLAGIDLALDTETRELRLSNLYLPAEIQGAGVGSLVMAQLALFGEELGLQSIYLQAGNVGRWAWMQCGFDFEDSASLEATVTAARQFAQALGVEVDLSAIEHTSDFLQLPGTVPAEQIRCAGGASIMPMDLPISLGKALVLGPVPAANPWWGRLRLGPESEGRVRLAKYIASHGGAG